MDLVKAVLRRPGIVILVSGLLAAVCVVQVLATKRTRGSNDRAARLKPKLPEEVKENGYVSSKRCQACHTSEYASWKRSFHRTMTQEAVPGNVVGAFDGSTVLSDGLTYRVFENENGFWAEMPDPDEMMYVVQGGKKLALDEIPKVELPVVMTTGSHHYQTYWVPSPRHDRLLQTLPLVYLIKDKQWIPREAAFMTAPNDRGHFVTQWNHHCIRCHSTGGNPGLNAETGMLETEVGELGISCEACHGPGDEHIRQNSDPIHRYKSHLAGAGDSAIVNPANLDHRRSSQVCGQCHGVYITRNEYAMEYAYKGVLYRPGDDLDRTRYYVQYPTEDGPEVRKEELRRNPEFYSERWWPDGTVLAGGREYTALSASACYLKGEISCLSCHSMHQSDPADQLRMDISESRSCTQCHDEPRFTSDVSRHTFHEPDSSGSNCLNCHMPHTTYALFGAIRSHQIVSPNLSSAVRYGVPNACNLCHLDKTLAWTQEHLVEWYGASPMRLTDEDREISAALMWLLKGDAAKRAIAAWHMGWKPAREVSGTDWMAPFQARLLSDPYGVVRYVAYQALKTLPELSALNYNFLASDGELAQSVTDVIEMWKGRDRGADGNGKNVLINPDGSVMESKVQDLLKNRDNRSVTIKE